MAGSNALRQTMTRQEKNEQFLLSSFLYGGNADYIENLYARWKSDAKSIDPTWASYFGRLEDSASDVARNSEGPSWQRRDWPQRQGGGFGRPQPGRPTPYVVVSQQLAASPVHRGHRTSVPLREALILQAALNHPWLLHDHLEELSQLENVLSVHWLLSCCCCASSAGSSS